MAIYFCENEKYLKIGWTDNLGKRLYSHEHNSELQMLAVMPGDKSDEEAVHRALRPYLIKGGEWYARDDFIYEWIWQLLNNGLATEDLEAVDCLSSLPSRFWMPGFDSQVSNANGQMLLWDSMPARTRIAMRAQKAYHNSITDEWYTPENLIERAKEVMGSITTDPATSVEVNQQFIRAKTFYTKAKSGLNKSNPWLGNVWLNPPYGRGDNSAGRFISRLVEELDEGNVKQAITCLNLHSMSSKWFYEVVPQACAMHCILNSRPKFFPPKGVKTTSSPTIGIVLSYFGEVTYSFERVFSPVGQILTPR